MIKYPCLSHLLDDFLLLDRGESLWDEREVVSLG